MLKLYVLLFLSALAIGCNGDTEAKDEIVSNPGGQQEPYGNCTDSYACSLSCSFNSVSCTLFGGCYMMACADGPGGDCTGQCTGQCGSEDEDGNCI